MNIVDKMRGDRKSPKILQLKVIKIQGIDPDACIFIYEGIDDLPVYEVWMARTGIELNYSAVAGAGREQLLNYFNELKESHDKKNKKIYFFIDRDFNSPLLPNSNIFELNVHSIENVLTNSSVLKSLLIDEFSCSDEIYDNLNIIRLFDLDKNNFVEMLSPINKIIYFSSKFNLKLKSKPEHIKEFMDINIGNIRFKPDKHCHELIVLEESAIDYDYNLISEEFEQLNCDQKCRGKFALQMFRMWIEALVEDRKKKEPQIFSSKGVVKGEPFSLPMRRYATASPLPDGFKDFIKRIFEAELASI